MPNLLSRQSSVFSHAAHTGESHPIADTGQPRTIALLNFFDELRRRVPSDK